MDDSDAFQFLRDRDTVVIGTVGPAGQPHLVTVSYAIVEEKLAFHAFARSQKVVNLLRDQRITCLVEDAAAPYDSIRGVQVVGRAEVTDDADRVRQVAVAVRANRAAADPSYITEKPIDEIVHGRVAVLVHPGRVASWDHRKLGSGY